MPGRWRDVRAPEPRRAGRPASCALPLDEASAKVRSGGPPTTTRTLRAPRLGRRDPARLRSQPACRRSPARSRDRRAGLRRGLAAAAAPRLLVAPSRGAPGQQLGPSPTSACCSTGGSKPCAASSPTGRLRRRTSLVRDLAEEARLASVEVQPRPPVESGARGEVVLDLTALGGYEEIDRFFQQVALSPRLVDVESLTLTATSETDPARRPSLRFPYGRPRAPLPPPPSRRSGRPTGVPRPTLDAFLRDQSLAFAKSDAIAARRRARRSPRLFLSEIAAVVRERPVVLAYASLGEDFTVRGLTRRRGPGARLREPARARLPPRLGVPHGEAGRLLPLRGPRQEPGRGAGRRAAGAGRTTRSTRTSCPAGWTATRAGALVIKGRAPTPRTPARARSPCACGTWTSPTSSRRSPCSAAAASSSRRRARGGSASR